MNNPVRVITNPKHPVDTRTPYQIAWDRIKNAPCGEETVIECHINARETLIQAILRIKSENNVALQAVGGNTFGQMTVTRYLKEDNNPIVRVGFRLNFNLNGLL